MLILHHFREINKVEKGSGNGFFPISALHDVLQSIAKLITQNIGLRGQEIIEFMESTLTGKCTKCGRNFSGRDLTWEISRLHSKFSNSSCTNCYNKTIAVSFSFK